MEKLIILFLINLIFVLIGVGHNRIKSHIAIIRFGKYELYNGEWLYAFARDAIARMGINYRIHIAIDRKRKNPNADVGVCKKDIFIVLHGKWDNEHLKFVISHELSHIRFGHYRENDNIFFVFSLLLICLFSFNLFEYIYPAIFENKYKSLIESAFSCVWVIIFAISYYICDIISKSRSQQNEKDADLQAAKIVGIKIAIDAISMLNDKSIFKSTHPSNKERIQYLVSNLNGE